MKYQTAGVLITEIREALSVVIKLSTSKPGLGLRNQVPGDWLWRKVCSNACDH